MANSSITIRMDENLKKQAERLFDEIGINMATAMTIFVKTAVRQQRIPFELVGEPFYSEMNQIRLSKAIDDINAGINISEHELVEVDDG